MKVYVLRNEDTVISVHKERLFAETGRLDAMRDDVDEYGFAFDYFIEEMDLQE